jgi:hypothetical protein
MSWTILAGQYIPVSPLLRETLKEWRLIDNMTGMGEDEKPINAVLVNPPVSDLPSFSGQFNPRAVAFENPMTTIRRVTYYY